MHDIGNIRRYTPRWQAIILLFAALHGRRGGMTKQEALQSIVDQRWFMLMEEDKIPYESNLERGCREPRWKTGICWARKDAVERGYLDGHRRDNWDILALGRDLYERFAQDFHYQRLDVRRCYLWAEPFKRKMYPDYLVTDRDTKRPIALYDDWLRRL